MQSPTVAVTFVRKAIPVLSGRFRIVVQVRQSRVGRSTTGKHAGLKLRVVIRQVRNHSGTSLDERHSTGWPRPAEHHAKVLPGGGSRHHDTVRLPQAVCRFPARVGKRRTSKTLGSPNRYLPCFDAPAFQSDFLKRDARDCSIAANLAHRGADPTWSPASNSTGSRSVSASLPRDMSRSLQKCIAGLVAAINRPEWRAQANRQSKHTDAE